MDTENTIKEENSTTEFYILRTIPNKEAKFIDAIYKYISKKENHKIISVFSPDTVKGYVFAETESLTTLKDTLRNVPNNKGVIQKPLQMEEIAKYLEKEGEKVIVNERDIVEMIAGPFKGDKAKVIRIVPGKDEVIIEPINVPVPIPITLNIENIRVLKEENKNE